MEFKSKQLLSAQIMERLLSWIPEQYKTVIESIRTCVVSVFLQHGIPQEMKIELQSG